MSTDPDPLLPEEATVPLSHEPKGQGRGYFFYIAVFFVLIGLLCYLLNSTSISLPEALPTAPAPATTSPATK